MNNMYTAMTICLELIKMILTRHEMSQKKTPTTTTVHYVVHLLQLPLLPERKRRDSMLHHMFMIKY